MMAPTTGYVVSPHQSPVMAMPPGHNVVPATIPQTASYVTPAPDTDTLLETPSPDAVIMDRSIKERLFDVSILYVLLVGILSYFTISELFANHIGHL
jgi:hypothetical protein